MYGFNVSNLNISLNGPNVNIKWQDPSDINWVGTKIIINYEHSPINNTDGALIIDSTIRDQYQNNAYIYTLNFPTQIFIKAFTHSATEYSDGIELNLTYISNTYVNNLNLISDFKNNYITWTDIADINWTGLKIIKKLNSAPVNVNDGELLLDNTESNKYQTTPFIDSIIDGNYYYGFFPYDITLHYYIGIINSNYLSPDTSAQILNESDRLEITWENGINYNLAGTKIIKKISSVPINVNISSIVVSNYNVSWYYTNPGNIHRRIVCNSDASVIYLTLGWEDTNYCLKVYKSIDYGQNWVDLNFPAHPGFKELYSTLCIDSNDNCHICYCSLDLNDVTQIWNRYGYWNGTIWSTPITLNPEMTNCNLDFGTDFQMVIDSSNNCHVIFYNRYANIYPNFNFMYTHQLNGNWTTPVAVADTLNDMSTRSQFGFCIDQNNNLHLIYNIHPTGDDFYYLYYKNCVNETWGSATLLYSDEISQYHIARSPNIIATTDRKLYVIFVNTDSINDSLNLKYMIYDGSSWNLPINISIGNDNHYYNGQLAFNNNNKVSYVAENDIDNIILERSTYPFSMITTIINDPSYNSALIYCAERSFVTPMYYYLEWDPITRVTNVHFNYTYSSDEQPINETDGESLNLANPLYDYRISNNKKYYYGIFPYDQNNNYIYNTIVSKEINYIINQDFHSFKIYWDDSNITNWDHTKVIKNSERQPTESNAEEGELLATVINSTEYQANPLRDYNIEPNRIYYYTIIRYNSSNEILNDIIYLSCTLIDNLILTPSVTQDSPNTRIDISWTNNPDFHTVAGIKIVRKIGSEPMDIGDGTLLIDITNLTTNSYSDSSVVPNTQYYYGIFPYDTENNYNYRAKIGIFYRDEFSPLDIISVNIYQDFNSIKLSWVDTQILDPLPTDWVGTKIIRKEWTHPTSETDGELLEIITERNKYEIIPFVDSDPNLSFETTYCYGIFPYDSDDNYNYNTVLYGTLNYYIKPKLNLNGGKIEISWTDLPRDMNTFNNWGNCKLVRKIGSAPIDDTNGIIIPISNPSVHGLHSITDDIGLIPTTQYFYGVFSYDTSNTLYLIGQNYNDIIFYNTNNYTITNTDIIQDLNTIEIKYQDPSDINWVGTKIIKKIGSALVNINDGILINTSIIRDEFAITAFVDSEIDNNTYYYGIFPYDILDNHNYDTILNINFVNKTPTNDITNTSIEQVSNTIEIRYQDPIDIDWRSTYIVKKIGSAPTDIDDGTIIKTSTIRDEFITTAFVDSEVDDNTYYYGIFTIDTDDNYNYNTVLSIDFINKTPTSDITNTSIEQTFNTIEIRYQDPTDPDWRSTYIIRKTGSTPVNIGDGTILEEVTERNKYYNYPFIDSMNLIHNITYYYGIFTVDTDDNYNYNTILSQTMSNITILQNFYNFKVYWNESIDPNWTKTYLVKKIGSASMNKNDGELLELITTLNKYQATPFIDCNMESNQTYFYSLFQYNNNTLLNTINLSSELFPCDVSNITILQDGHDIKINWTDTTHYSRVGIKLIKKLNEAPIDENDGELLEDITDMNKYQTTPFVDSNTIDNTIYFYGIFSYDIDDNYNYQITSIFFEDKFPTNDIIYPVIIQNIDHFEINWTDPLNPDWKGTKLIKKLNIKPIDETDGELLEDITILNKYENTPFVDSNVIVAQTYCYGIFPYDNGVNGININYNYNTTLYKTLAHYIKINLNQNYNNIEIKWEDLDFTNWKGSKLIRKTGSVPVDKNDCDLDFIPIYTTERNQYKINPFLDYITNDKIGTTYYYAVFSYNKNDEFYDYIKFIANSIQFEDQFTLQDIINPAIIQNEDVINLNWENPNDTRLYGVRIIRKEDIPPIDENDGTILINITDLNIHNFTDITTELEKNYYYGIFPYNINDNFNLNTVLNIFFNDIIIRNIQNPIINFRNNTIQLTWEDPDIADWLGTEIVKKIGSSPIDRNDGTIISYNFIKNNHSIIPLLDQNVDFNTIYYYGIFPYDNNNHNYNTVLSKDLHILSVTNLKISQSTTNEQLYVSYEDPADSNWNRTKIIRKENNIPINENDGITIIDSTTRNEYKESFFIDTELIPGQYYGYRAITYDRFENINRDTAFSSASPNLIIDFNYDQLFNYYDNIGWNILTQPYVNDASGIHYNNYIRANGKTTKTFTLKNIVVPTGKTGTIIFNYDFYQCYYESKSHFQVAVNGITRLSINPSADAAAFGTNKTITLNAGNNTISFIYYGTKDIHYFPPYINIYDIKINFN